MKRMSEVDAAFEAALRKGAEAMRQSAPPDMAARVMSEIRTAGSRRDNTLFKDRGGAWHRAATAAALAVVATLAVAIVLLRGAPMPMVASDGPPRGMTDVEVQEVAPPGPMAMLVSLHRAPDDFGSALRDAVNHEVNLIFEEALREQKLFLARLPLRGRIDPDADAGFDATEAR